MAFYTIAEAMDSACKFEVDLVGAQCQRVRYQNLTTNRAWKCRFVRQSDGFVYEDDVPANTQPTTKNLPAQVRNSIIVNWKDDGFGGQTYELSGWDLQTSLSGAT